MKKYPPQYNAFFNHFHIEIKIKHICLFCFISRHAQVYPHYFVVLNISKREKAVSLNFN
jgi:hypothetical protein